MNETHPNAIKTWRVVRDCCTSGNCSTCLGARTGKGSVRVVHADKVTRDWAMKVALSFARYRAIAEPMPEMSTEKLTDKTESNNG